MMDQQKPMTFMDLHLWIYNDLYMDDFWMIIANLRYPTKKILAG